MFSPILLFVQREGDNGVTRDEGTSRVTSLATSHSAILLQDFGSDRELEL